MHLLLCCICTWMCVSVCMWPLDGRMQLYFMTEVSPAVYVGVCVLQDSSLLSLKKSLACDVPEKKKEESLIETARLRSKGGIQSSTSCSFLLLLSLSFKCHSIFNLFFCSSPFSPMITHTCKTQREAEHSLLGVKIHGTHSNCQR